MVSRSGGRARSWVSTARPSATAPLIPTPTETCAGVCGTLPATIPAGAIAGLITILRREGHHLNRKKVQRLWREEGLRVPPRRHKRPRLGVSTTPADRLRATHPNHVWALDYQFDVTSAGRTLKLLHVTNEFTRESLSDLVAYSIDADRTVAVLDRLVEERGAPAFIRCDNGPELTANALRDWCTFAGTGTSYIEPGSPWQNPWVESYGSRIRDELLAIEQFDTLLEAQVLVADWPRRVQHLSPPLRPRHAHAGRVRRSMEGSKTASAHVAGGPINGGSTMRDTRRQ